MTMRLSIAGRVAGAVAGAVAGSVIAAPGVSADPATPQAGTPCSQDFVGALTQLPDSRTMLFCRAHPGAAPQWEVFDDPYPHSERWLTYGPTLTLHGEGMRNREIESGAWVALAQDPQTRCSATQLAVVSSGKVGAPQVSTADPGQPLAFQVLPLLFSIEMSGNCLWEKA